MSEPSNTTSGGYPVVDSKSPSNDHLTGISQMASQPPAQAEFSRPPAENPAVLRCCKAYNTSIEASVKQGRSRSTCESEAARAYRQAMPPLAGAPNIRDFIACVAHAMLLEVVQYCDGTRLLYAAQVAYSTVDTRTHRATQKQAGTAAPPAQTAH